MSHPYRPLFADCGVTDEAEPAPSPGALERFVQAMQARQIEHGPGRVTLRARCSPPYLQELFEEIAVAGQVQAVPYPTLCPNEDGFVGNLFGIQIWINEAQAAEIVLEAAS